MPKFRFTLTNVLMLVAACATVFAIFATVWPMSNSIALAFLGCVATSVLWYFRRGGKESPIYFIVLVYLLFSIMANSSRW